MNFQNLMRQILQKQSQFRSCSRGTPEHAPSSMRIALQLQLASCS